MVTDARNRNTYLERYVLHELASGICKSSAHGGLVEVGAIAQQLLLGFSKSGFRKRNPLTFWGIQCKNWSLNDLAVFLV